MVERFRGNKQEVNNTLEMTSETPRLGLKERTPGCSLLRLLAKEIPRCRFSLESGFPWRNQRGGKSPRV